MRPINSNHFVSYSLLAVFFGSTIALSQLPWSEATGKEPLKSQGKMDRQADQAIAVVELFTSEGCSSCPPADENLQRIADAAARSDQQVFPLSFHVDYWNRLGWKDPFSQARFTERQREYSQALSSDTYTPQMIVNGTLEFVGSNHRQSDQALELALKKPAKHAINLSLATAAGGQRKSYRYQVTGPLGTKSDATDQVLNVAVATDMESVSVKRGENSGRQLTHVWVVKDLQVIPLTTDEGTFEIDPALVQAKHSRVIVYVQSRKSRAITGASAVNL